MITEVYEICNAFETGVRHGLETDNQKKDPYSKYIFNKAYRFGYELGLLRVKECPHPKESLLWRDGSVCCFECRKIWHEPPYPEQAGEL